MQRKGSWTVCLASASLALVFAVLSPGRGDPSDWNVSLLMLGAAGIASAIIGYPSESRSRLGRLIRWAALLFPAYVVFQLIPLPLSVVRLISPTRAEIAEALGAVTPLARLCPLSVAPANTFLYLARVCGYAVTFLVIGQLTRVFRHKLWVLAMPVMAAGVVEALLGLSGTLNGETTISGTYLDRDLFAGFLEMVFPLVFLYGVVILYQSSERGRFDGWNVVKSCAIWLSAAAVLMAIVLSFSKMGLVSVVGSLCVVASIALSWTASGWKKWSAMAAIAVALIVTFMFSMPNELIAQFGAAAFDPTIEGRWPIWKDTLHLIAAYPLFGCGLGNFSSAFPKYETAGLNVGWRWAHNDYLQMLSELGIVGILIPATFVFGISLRAIRVSRFGTNRDARFMGAACAGSIAALLIHSVAEFNMYIPANAMVLSWIAGLLPCIRDSGLEERARYSIGGSSFTRKAVFILGSLAGIYAATRLIFDGAVRNHPQVEHAFCRFGICDSDTVALSLRNTSGEFKNASLSRPALLELVGRDAASPARWCDLGEAYEKAGEMESARYCFSRALSLGPHIPYVFFRVGGFYLDSGNTTKGLDLIAKGLEADPASGQGIFADYEQRQIPVNDILRLGLRDPLSHRMYLAFLINHAKIADAGAAWDWVASRSYADDKLANEYIWFLLQHGKPEAAAQAWAQYASQREKGYPDRNLIFNGDFESAPAGSPFDWTVEQTPGANIDFDTASPHAGARSLRIEFDGTQNLTNIHVGETVFLKPGHYRFQAYIRSKDISTDEGVSFRVASDRMPKGLSFTTEPVLGSTDWTLVQHSFVVPQTAAGLFEIRLVRTPSLRFDNLIKGTLWIDQLSISAESPPFTTPASSRKASLSAGHS